MDRSVAQGPGIKAGPANRLVRAVRFAAAPAVVGAMAFAAARQAMLPGLGFWDTAELQTVGPVMGTAHPGGFPTWVLLGWLASVVLQPFGDPAFRMNLFAGLCLAGAAGLTVDLARTLTRSTALGVAAGLGLALTPLAWSIGTHAEAHALHLVFVAVLLRLMVGWEDAVRAAVDRGESPRAADRWLLAAAVAFGLSAGNHSLTLLLALPMVLFVRRVDRTALRSSRLLATCALAAAGALALVYLELPLRAGPFRAPLVYGRPETWDGFWYVVLGEQFRANVINPFVDLGGRVGALVGLATAELGILAAALPLGLFVTALRRPAYALLTGWAALLTVVFAASYQNAEIGRYYLGPLLIAWTWLAVLGGALLGALRAVARRSTIARAPASALIAAALAGVLLAPTGLTLGDRFRAIDESTDRDAPSWVDAALDRLPRDAVLVSWWSYSTPLWYAQLIEGRRPDVLVIDDRTRLDQDLGDIDDVIDAHLGTRPVYIIRDDPEEAAALAERYELEVLYGVDARSLTRVVRRLEPAS